MSPVYAAYLLAFILASVACSCAAWRARSVPQADTRRGLMAFFLGSSAWAAAYVGFLLVGTALGRHLFYQLSLIVGFGTVFAWLWFCSAYSGRGLHRNRSVQQFAAVVFVVVTGLKVTNPWHGLYYSLEPSGGAFGLVVSHEMLYWVVMALAYALAATGYLMLFELFLKTKTQTGPLTLLTGLTALPAALNVIGYANASILDVTHEPLGVAVFAVGLLLVYETQFSVVQLSGSVGDPYLTLGTEGQILGIGGGVAEMVPPLSKGALEQSLPETLPGLARTIREESSVWEADFDGDRRFFRVVQASLKCMGQIQTVILSDITERKERARELRRSERRFLAMLNDPNILAGLLSPDGTFLKVNDTAMEYVEPTPDDVVGQLFWNTPWWDEETRPVIRKKVQRAANGEYVEYKTDLETSSGEPYCVSGIIRPVTGKEGEVVSLFVTARDITERKQKAKRLEEAKERAELAKLEAEEASRMKSAMLANMSHEIRTPLTSIIGFSKAIGDEIEELGDSPDEADLSQLARFSGLIEEGGTRLLETLDSVLNLSKLEAGQMELSAKPVDLATEAECTADELRQEARAKKINVRLQTESVHATADDGGVQIVARNLLTNAIKYTGEGGTVWVRTYREEDAAQSENAAVLEVEDTGIGMEPEMAEGLFDPFRQASEGYSREYEGTGVGLAVTREATEQMGGSIGVETEKGKGSRFVVRLPQAEDRKMRNGKGERHEMAEQKGKRRE